MCMYDFVYREEPSRIYTLSPPYLWLCSILTSFSPPRIEKIPFFFSFACLLRPIQFLLCLTNNERKLTKNVHGDEMMTYATVSYIVILFAWNTLSRIVQRIESILLLHM